MKKRLMVVGLLVVFLAASSAAFAADVYVTSHGKKYHQADCPLIKSRETSTMSEKEAVEAGLEPCAKCFRKKALKAESPKESKKIKTEKKKKQK